MRLAVLTIWLLLEAVQPAVGQEAAPETIDQYYRGRVVEIVREETRDLAGYPQLSQRVIVEMGGRRVSAEYSEPRCSSRTRAPRCRCSCFSR